MFRDQIIQGPKCLRHNPGPKPPGTEMSRDRNVLMKTCPGSELSRDKIIKGSKHYES